MQDFRELFTQDELNIIENADLIHGHTRHPTWFPLFHHETTRAIDHLVRAAIFPIAQQNGGEEWLKDLKPRLLDFKDVSNASSALSEIRTYGGLLQAGFSMTPIPRIDEATPDFLIDAGDGPITVEVFAKHQDKKQDKRVAGMHAENGPLPEGVERRNTQVGHNRLTMTMGTLAPGGEPDPNKQGDSVQANMISRVCSMKTNETQLPEQRPALLVAHFTHFGVWPEALKQGQARPVETGHHGFTSGALWYAFYGWKGAPVFEELAHRLVRMGHEGRFRQTGAMKSKLSGVLLVLSEGVVLLENPWAMHRLPDNARLALCRYPWFDIGHSISDWNPGDADALVAVQRRMIEALDQLVEIPQF